MAIRSETVLKEKSLMPSCYHHLSYDERVQIEVMISVGLSLRQIDKRQKKAPQAYNHLMPHFFLSTN